MVLSYSCVNKKDDKVKIKLKTNNHNLININLTQINTFQEAFSYYLISDKIEDSLIIKLLEDSISYYGFYKFYYNDSICVDNIDKTNYFKIDQELDDIYCIKERNGFSISIDKNDTVLYEGFLASNNMKIVFRNFILNPLNDKKLPEKTEIDVNHFGKFIIAKQGFFINASLIPDSLGRKASWQKLKKIVKGVLASYNDIRDEYALKFYGKYFDLLELEEKKIICQLVPINIFIYPYYKSIAEIEFEQY